MDLEVPDIFGEGEESPPETEYPEGYVPGPEAKFADGPRVTPRHEHMMERRDEALRLRLGGYTYTQIGEAMGMTHENARLLIGRAIAEAPNEKATEQRAIENARLDRLQAAVWTEALKGDIKSVDAVLRISRRRAELNGLDAPRKIDLRSHVRIEVESVVQELHDVILGEVIPAAAVGELGGEILDAGRESFEETLLRESLKEDRRGG